AALRDRHDTFERDRMAETIQVLDHQLDAAPAILAEPSQPLLERAVRGIKEIPENVCVAPLRLRVQLDRRDDPNAEALARVNGLAGPRQRVVIGQREGFHASLEGETHELRRLEDTVRTYRVRVKVGVVRGLRHATSIMRSQ